MQQVSDMQHPSTTQYCPSIAIIGAGLSGLYLAHQLTEQKGKQWAAEHLRVFESSDDCGGRIPALHTRDRTAYLDLGPSWLWPDEQPHMVQVVEKFKLALIPQWQQGMALYQSHPEQTPKRYRDIQSYYGAYRIDGGSYKLIEALLNSLPETVIVTGHHLLQLGDDKDSISLHFKTTNSPIVKQLEAKQVVLTLPPRIVAASLDFSPALPESLRSVLQTLPTWMAGQAKAIIEYQQPFWRKAGFSGAAQLNFAGTVVGEVFDLCGDNGSPAILGTFLALPPELRQQYRQKLPELILAQLAMLFGADAATPVNLHIQDWFQNPRIATPQDAAPLYEHPRYGHKWLALDHWNDKLFYAGTETAERAGGYMEGALNAAERVLAALSLSAAQEPA